MASSRQKPSTACPISHPRTSTPNADVRNPNRATLKNHAFKTLFCQDHRDWPLRLRRRLSRFHADRRLPKTDLGMKNQRLSPSRELDGSRGVATFTWWPRLCATKKCP